ncbi:hypothetical protein P171DRAFT_423656 [Karstenula rhodostoma CBS 690.94]|uniref:DUF676 domain-containing protein n=1 Tax=Karstenula rhodostoma CBS 690.94 TaxID=1392251 RepID=A0A9P4P8I9_9PLEO|nr:hypothetical protein P171DRAFT_423656 [Karstenula rhodostoma CBS 690.94]
MPHSVFRYLKERAKNSQALSRSQLVAHNNTSSTALTMQSPPILDDSSLSALALDRSDNSLEVTDSSFGIRTVSDPSNAEIDIWLVHGLTGNRDSTWTHSNGTFTPDLLRAKFPTARIITYGYDANVIGLWKNAGGEGLRGHGKALAYAVSNSRSGKDKDTRPLYFVAHSLGGLVAEQALLISLEPADPRLHSIAKCTAGIVFMGTPHSGSYLATWGYTLARLLDRIWRTNKELISLLKRESEVLRAVEEIFQRQLATDGMLHHVKVFCFYETVAVDVVGFVVPEESATILPYPNCGIDANHMDMSKFTSLRDAGFISLKGVLDNWIEEGKEEAACEIPSEAKRTSFPERLTFHNHGPIEAGVFQHGTGNAGRDYYRGNVTHQSAGRDWVNGDRNLYAEKR